MQFMRNSRFLRGASWTMLSVAVALIAVLPASIAQARHEQELAEGLARDFGLFELAKQILREQLERRDLADDAKSRLALSLNSILLAEATKATREGNMAEADRLKREAQEVITQYAGQGTSGRLNLYNSKMQEAGGLIDEMERATDDDERNEKRRAAITLYEECRNGYHDIRATLFAKYERLSGDARQQFSNGEEGEHLRLSWYYYAQTLYELAKLGEQKQRNLELLFASLDEMVFEFEGAFVAYYASLLMGDAYVLDEQWGKATGEYDSVLSLPVNPPGINAQLQTALDELRMTAYHKVAMAYLKRDNLQRVVNTVNQMFADYPGKDSVRNMKLCRLLKAEAMMKLRLEGQSDVTIEQIIQELQPFATDPDRFFRMKYLEVLANVGRYPNLDLSLRLRCGRAAFDSGKFQEAAQIYQMVLSSLRVSRGGRVDAAASRINFERYAPEAYWRLGESLAFQWRFFEAALVFHHAAQRFTYFAQDARFEDGKTLPRHMLGDDGLSVFEKFENMEKIRGFPLELAQRARTCITVWSPAGRHPENTNQSMPGSVEAKWRDDIINFERQIKNKVGTDRAELQRDLFSRAWRLYNNVVSQGDNADYMPAISMFATIDAVIGEDLHFEAFNFCADLMRREFNKRMTSSVRIAGDPFPEDTNDPDNPVRGEQFYRWEKSRLGNDLLARVPDHHLAKLRELLDQILDRDVQGNVKLLYYYKMRYFYLRLFYMVTSRVAGELTQQDSEIWSRPIGEILREWASLMTSRLEEMDDATGRKVRQRMRDIAYAAYYYGNALRINPWNREEDREKAFMQHDPEAPKIDSELKEQCLDVWRNFQPNYTAGFTNKTDTADHERQQERFRSLVKGVMYFSFFMQVNARRPKAAEEVMEQFERAFPADVRAKDDQLVRWHGDFIYRLARSYDLVNFEESRRYSLSAGGLGPIVGRLKSAATVTPADLRRNVENNALFCRVLTPAGDIACMRETDLYFALLAVHLRPIANQSFIGDDGRLNTAGLESYMAEFPQSLNSLSSSVREWLAYLKEPNTTPMPSSDLESAIIAITKVTSERIFFDRKALLEFIASRDIEFMTLDNFLATAKDVVIKNGNSGQWANIISFAERNNLTLDNTSANALFNAVKDLGPSDLPPSQLMSMYQGHRIRTFSDRYNVANEIERVQIIYIQAITRLERQSLTYWARYYDIDEKENPTQYDARKKYEIGKRFFQAEMWDRTLQYLEGIFDGWVSDGRFRSAPQHPFGLSVGTAPALNWQRDELVLRYYIGRCYIEKAVASGGYNPNSQEWQKAEAHLARLFQFIEFRNRERQRGVQEPINFESLLDPYYYIILARLSRLYEAKAKHFSTSNRADALKAWEEAKYLFALVQAQSPDLSPDQRIARLEYIRVCFEIAKLGTDKIHNDTLMEAVKVLEAMFLGQDPEKVVLFGDVAYSQELRKIYADVMKLRSDRNLN